MFEEQERISIAFPKIDSKRIQSDLRYRTAWKGRSVCGKSFMMLVKSEYLNMFRNFVIALENRRIGEPCSG